VNSKRERLWSDYAPTHVADCQVAGKRPIRGLAALTVREWYEGLADSIGSRVSQRVLCGPER